MEFCICYAFTQAFIVVLKLQPVKLNHQSQFSRIIHLSFKISLAPLNYVISSVKRFKLSLLLSMFLLAASFSLGMRQDVAHDCHFQGQGHMKGDKWCDPVRCGKCHCFDMHVVMCENTVSSKDRILNFPLNLMSD